MWTRSSRALTSPRKFSARWRPARCLLAVIGPNWLTATDERGRRRLDDPDDFVRLEIEAALARGVRVIPILVEGAVMPGREDLPESLAGLAHRNALLIRHESFRSDAGRLVTAIERVLAPAPGTAAVSGVPGARSVRSAGNAFSEVAQNGSGPAGNDPGRATRLLADAERIANSITDESSKASALSGVAKALAATDPDRATRLLTNAERIANSITDESSKASALSRVAEALAATDPDRAERIANSITDESSKASALSDVAEALAATDPGRAERIANSITDESSKALALSDVAEALAATDPDRAERIANSITGEYLKALALSGVAKALAATDPDRAERIANSITDEYLKASALTTSRRRWQPPTPTRALPSRTHRQLHHRRVLEGIGAEQRREGTGSHRPRPGYPLPKPHRQLHHRRVFEGIGAERRREGAGSHRPRPGYAVPTPNASPTPSPTSPRRHRR